MKPFAQALNELREQIALLRTRSDALKHAPPSRDEIKTNLQTYLKTEADSTRSRLSNHLLSDVGSALKLRVSPAGYVDLAPVLALLLGHAQVTKVLLSCLDIPEGAPSVADRAAELQEVEDRLYGLELKEEVTIRALEDAGHSIIRRADARPEIVLAMVDGQGHVL